MSSRSNVPPGRQAERRLNNLLHHQRVKQWAIGLDSWIIQDGNYPDFAVGQQAEFAVEFYLPESPVVAATSQPSIEPIEGSAYEIRGQVVAIVGQTWVLDCGRISIYQVTSPLTSPPVGIAAGDMVHGRANLGIDPFFYFENLYSQADPRHARESARICSALPTSPSPA
jgi:hypothetical protein